MTSNVQISGKSSSGIIFVVGGDNFDDFFANLITAYEGDAVQANETVKQAVSLITPMSSRGGGPNMDQAINNVQQGFGQGNQQNQQPPQNQGYANNQQQGYNQQPQQQNGGWGNQNDNRQQNDGPPPGQQAPYCPNHNQPAKWVPGGFSSRTNKAYTGFWSCNQGDKNCKIRS